MIYWFFVVPGSAVKCQKCQQNCDNAPLVDCPSGYCYTSSYTLNGVLGVERGCGAGTICPNNAGKICDVIRALGAKSCAVDCCDTDNCNNYTPSSAPGVMITKFTLSLMVIVAYLFA